jgi:hypothetical protein
VLLRIDAKRFHVHPVSVLNTQMYPEVKQAKWEMSVNVVKSSCGITGTGWPGVG